MTIGGKLNLQDGEALHNVSIKAPDAALTENVILTLPDNDGDADQVLTTDGSGVLSWTSALTPVNLVATYTGTNGIFEITDGFDLTTQCAVVIGIKKNPAANWATPIQALQFSNLTPSTAGGGNFAIFQKGGGWGHPLDMETAVVNFGNFTFLVKREDVWVYGQPEVNDTILIVALVTDF